MRKRIESPSGSWKKLVESCGLEIDHIHGVIRTDDGETHIIHMDVNGIQQGPQTLLKDGDYWSQEEFDSVSLDEWHD